MKPKTKKDNKDLVDKAESLAASQLEWAELDPTED